MNIEEFNAFDIGVHYVKLQELGVVDKDIGKFLRRFVEGLAPLIASESKWLAYGVETFGTGGLND